MRIEKRGKVHVLVDGEGCRPASIAEVELYRQNKEMEQAIKIIWTWATFDVEHSGYRPALDKRHVAKLLNPIIERIQKCE
jgi:hypothetical protein